MDVLVMVNELAGGRELREDVRRWEDLGVTGMLLTDHLFPAGGGRRAEGTGPADPVVALAAAGAMSETLTLGTIVANVGFAHPALMLRHFAQLAALFGGERVVAGLGAGWNREEFEALGQTMPPFRERADRLEETLRLARALFTDGRATIDGTSVTTRDLPLAPRPAVPPRLLIGGGSDRVLHLAGQYADWVDLNGSSRQLPLGGRGTTPARRDGIRRLTTTVGDLSVSVERLAAATRDAGRPVAAVRRSVLVDTIEFCADSEVADRARSLRESRGAPPDADATQSPYLLFGSPARMRDVLAGRRERLGLGAIIVPAHAPLEQFMREVATAS